MVLSASLLALDSIDCLSRQNELDVVGVLQEAKNADSGILQEAENAGTVVFVL